MIRQKSVLSLFLGKLPASQGQTASGMPNVEVGS
jgi:hypothetical protein